MLRIHAAAFAAVSLSVSLAAQAHWTRRYPAQSPPARNTIGMASDVVAGGAVLFGGQNSSGVMGDTWTFDGVQWQPRIVPGPSARSGHGMVCDTARNRVVLFGGWGNGYRQDTWEWNGAAWTQLATGSAPSAREGMAMAYDEGRHVTVLFGGFDSGSRLADTWEWNGATWLPRTTSSAPSGRLGAAMAFDPSLGGVLLFGGAANGPIYDDTWHWDGAAWQQMQPGNPPYSRVLHRMVTDTARRRIVMFGGLYWDPTVWEWDGAQWAARATPAPTPRMGFGFAYDPLRREALLFGGDTGAISADTWVYRTDAPALFQTIGPGCAGTAGAPQLANAPYTLPWIGDTFTTRVAPVPANGALLFATGFDAPAPISLTPYGMPGCDFAVQIAETRLAIATAAGSADWSLAIPNAAGLAGVAIAQQVLVLDPGANIAGAVVSSAGRFTVGIR